MSHNKNIDRLFQEKFKDFEITPNDAVWEKIKTRQNEKQKRRILIPFWFRFGGAAALIVILFTIGSIAINSDEKKNTLLTNSDVESKKNNEILTKNPVSTEGIVKSSNKDKKTTELTNSDNGKQNSNNEMKNPKFFDNLKSNNNTIVSTTKDRKQSTTSSSKIVITNPQHDKTTRYQISSAPLKKDKPSNNSTLSRKGNYTIAQKTVIEKSKTNDLIKEKSLTFNDIQNNKNSEGGLKIAKNNSNSIASNKEIVEKPTKNQNNTPEKSIFDAIKKEEDEIVINKPKSLKKWNLTPNIAPVYYSSIGNGSPIDSQYSDNKKEGQINGSHSFLGDYAKEKKHDGDFRLVELETTRP